MVVVLDFSQISNYVYEHNVDGIERCEFDTTVSLNVNDEIKIQYPGAQLKYWNGSNWAYTDIIFHGYVENVQQTGNVYHVVAYGVYYKLAKRHIKDVILVSASDTYSDVVREILYKVFGYNWAYTENHVIIIGTDKTFNESKKFIVDEDGLSFVKKTMENLGVRVFFWHDLVFLHYPDGYYRSSYTVRDDNVSMLKVKKNLESMYNVVYVEGLIDTFSKSTYQKFSEDDVNPDDTFNFAFLWWPEEGFYDYAPDTVDEVYVDGVLLDKSKYWKKSRRTWVIDVSQRINLYPDWPVYNDIIINNNSNIGGSGVVVKLIFNNNWEIMWSAITTDSNNVPKLKFVQIDGSTVYQDLPFWVDTAETNLSNNYLVVYVKLHRIDAGGRAYLRMYYGNTDSSSSDSNKSAVIPKIYDSVNGIGLDVFREVESLRDDYGYFGFDGNTIVLEVKTDCTNPNWGDYARVAIYNTTGEGNYYEIYIALATYDFYGDVASACEAEMGYYDANGNRVSLIKLGDSWDFDDYVGELYFGDKIKPLTIWVDFEGWCGTYSGYGKAVGYVYVVRSAIVIMPSDFSYELTSVALNGEHTIMVYYTYRRPYFGFAKDDVSISNYGIRSRLFKLSWVDSDELANQVAQEILNYYKDMVVEAKFEHGLPYWLTVMKDVWPGYEVYINSSVYNVSGWYLVRKVKVSDGKVEFDVGRVKMDLSRYLKILENRYGEVRRAFMYNMPRVNDSTGEIKWY